MTDISATEAARKFSDLLDAVESRGERFTIVRHGRVVAEIAPVPAARGRAVKDLLRTNTADAKWAKDLAKLRQLVEIEKRR